MCQGQRGFGGNFGGSYGTGGYGDYDMCGYRGYLIAIIVLLVIVLLVQIILGAVTACMPYCQRRSDGAANGRSYRTQSPVRY